MYTFETKIRVRYAETDKMGYAHHSNYASYIEEARTEMMRSIGISYLEMENKGVMLPVLELQTTFLKPAFYDDVITVKTIVSEYPSIRFKLSYEIYNQKKELMSTAKTTLVFVNAETMKPMRPPTFFLEKLDQFFEVKD